MSRALVRVLRARNVDVITAREAGMVERRDEEHLEAATAGGRVLLSSNVADFYRIHTAWLQAGRSHAGLILAPQQRYSVGEKARQLLKVLAEKSAEEIVDQAWFLSP